MSDYELKRSISDIQSKIAHLDARLQWSSGDLPGRANHPGMDSHNQNMSSCRMKDIYLPVFGRV
jgi:hypothetical protein